MSVITVKQHIVDEIGFERTISRLAHEILERNQGTGNLAIVGIRTRGEFIARRLHDKLQAIEQGEIPFGVLDVTLYRDDFWQHLRQPEVRATEILFNLTGRDVILVDDVLYTGRTVRSALDALMDMGRAKSIQLAVLVDRGHRELPIRADFTGKSILTGAGEEIRVLVREVDGVDAINLVESRP
jgi:pyrimidine operon attenuation protein/uracil phosphoribosyltransferase